VSFLSLVCSYIALFCCVVDIDNNIKYIAIISPIPIPHHSIYLSIYYIIYTSSFKTLLLFYSLYLYIIQIDKNTLFVWSHSFFFKFNFNTHTPHHHNHHNTHYKQNRNQKKDITYFKFYYFKSSRWCMHSISSKQA